MPLGGYRGEFWKEKTVHKQIKTMRLRTYLQSHHLGKSLLDLIK